MSLERIVAADMLVWLAVSAVFVGSSTDKYNVAAT